MNANNNLNYTRRVNRNSPNNFFKPVVYHTIPKKNMNVSNNCFLFGV